MKTTQPQQEFDSFGFSKVKTIFDFPKFCLLILLECEREQQQQQQQLGSNVGCGRKRQTKEIFTSFHLRNEVHYRPGPVWTFRSVMQNRKESFRAKGIHCVSGIWTKAYIVYQVFGQI